MVSMIFKEPDWNAVEAIYYIPFRPHVPNLRVSPIYNTAKY